MKIHLNILVIILLLFIVSCSHNWNKYNLDIVSDMSVYEETVVLNPDNRLVDLEKVIPNIILDIRYATKNNFTNEIIYKSPKAFIREPVSRALIKIQEELNKKGLGLKIFDAYRPYAATVKFYEVYPDTNFVAAPWRGSVHNRGCAVDLTIVDLKTEKEFEMPTLFDDFSEKASHNYIDLPNHILYNRQFLLGVMTKYGFERYVSEWWHYSFKGWDKYDLMDLPIEELSNKV